MTDNAESDGPQERAWRELEDRWPVVDRLDGVRQHVVVQMALNLGVTGLMAMRRFVAAVEFGFWITAAEEILTSPWAEVAKHRAAALAEMMRAGPDATGPRPQTA